ncbi:MAG: ammonium transporter, partial [Methylococcaceae bacterium]
SISLINKYLRERNTPPSIQNQTAAVTPHEAGQHAAASVVSPEVTGYEPTGGEAVTGKLPNTLIDTSSYAAPLEAMLAAVLVFLAPLGFSFLEASRTEQSKIPPILLRNLLVTAIMMLTFATVGSWISYGQSLLTSISPAGSELAPNGTSNDTFWLFHLEMTIMVGLVANTILANRISLWGHALMALVLGAVVHPLMGRWIWMGHWLPIQPGWLQELGFLDFAGATVIHSMGAWFSLAWLWRFPQVSHHASDETTGNPVYALMALFVLWLNWFGLAMGYHHLDVQLLALPIINVSLAGGTAVIVSFLLSINRLHTREADSSLIYYRLATGVLGGLVAVSAGVDRFTPIEAMMVGGLASAVQTFSYRFLQTKLLKQDHTSAALIATHGISGVFGTLCLGFMGHAGSFIIPEIGQLGIQSLGVAVALGFGLLAGLITALPYSLIAGHRPVAITPFETEASENQSGTLAQELHPHATDHADEAPTADPEPTETQTPRTPAE